MHPKPLQIHLTKYITLRDSLGAVHPVLFPSTLQHKMMVPPSLQPVSAGCALIHNGQLTISDVGSDSLGLNPLPADQDLLSQLINQ